MFGVFFASVVGLEAILYVEHVSMDRISHGREESFYQFGLRCKCFPFEAAWSSEAETE